MAEKLEMKAMNWTGDLMISAQHGCKEADFPVSFCPRLQFKWKHNKQNTQSDEAPAVLPF